jgi:TPR repeat protein
MLYKGRFPFDELWRKDLKDCRVIVGKDKKIYAGPFYHLAQIEPILDYYNVRRPERLYTVRRYQASDDELELDVVWFTECCDFDWLKKQANTNNTVCQRILGFAYANQWTPGANYDTRVESDRCAFYWLKRAAENSDSHAKTLLSRLTSIRQEDKPHTYYSKLSYGLP